MDGQQGRQITVYLAGDSTVQTYRPEFSPQAGWGQFIARYFDEEVRFVNKAIGGRSSRTFVEEGRLDEIWREIREGDYLFVQMGHNDSTVSKPERYTAPYTDYKKYLRMYVQGARERGAIPLLITPVGRLNYKDGEFCNDFPDYCAAMKQVAEEENVRLIDLMAKSLAYYAAIGYDEASTLFMISHNGTDCTHFTEKGADRIARLVALGVKELDLGISAHVRVPTDRNDGP
jgi:lysophospholipase L1-like esterase